MGMLGNIKSDLTLGNFLKEKVDWQMIKKVLGIGLPFGFENGMFFLGRLIVLSVVSLFGTTVRQQIQLVEPSLCFKVCQVFQLYLV